MSLGVGKLATASGSSPLPAGIRKGVASDSKEPPGASSLGESQATSTPRSLWSAKNIEKTIPEIYLTQAFDHPTYSMRKRLKSNQNKALQRIKAFWLFGCTGRVGATGRLTPMPSVRASPPTSGLQTWSGQPAHAAWHCAAIPPLLPSHISLLRSKSIPAHANWHRPRTRGSCPSPEARPGLAVRICG